MQVRGGGHRGETEEEWGPVMSGLPAGGPRVGPMLMSLVGPCLSSSGGGISGRYKQPLEG